MSEVKYVKIPLKTIFASKRGNSSYTKLFCKKHAGEFEVYTGTTKTCFGKISFYDYDTPSLTYTTDGEYAGTINVLDGRYSIGGHRALLSPIAPNLDIRYFKFLLQPLFYANVKGGSVPSINWGIIKNLEVSIPVDSNGDYDINHQKKMANHYMKLEAQKRRLLSQRQVLIQSYVNIPLDNYKFKEFELQKLFIYERGISCTRKYCNQHKGKYPVFSANNNIPLAHVDFYHYDGRYITLSRNGIAGKITIISGKFSINEDRFILIPKDENIDYEYIKYIVEPVLRNSKRGREGHNGQNEFTKLSFRILDSVKIKIPIKDDGNYDLEAQQQIAEKYRKIDNIKSDICSKVDTLLAIEVAI